MQRCEKDFMGRSGAARARLGVPAGTQAWVALLCIVAAMGVWTSSARALGYVQEEVSFTGLGDAQSVAVDSANNVYAGDVSTPQVLESQAVTSQQFQQKTLSFSGLFDPEAIAVDRAGDVFAADGFNKRVVEVPPGPVPPGGDQKAAFHRAGRAIRRGGRCGGRRVRVRFDQ